MSSVQFDQTSTTDQGIDHTSNVPAQTAFTAIVLMRINTYADWGDPLTLSNDNSGNHRYHGLEFDAAGSLYHHRNANTNVPNYGAVNLWTDSYTGWAWIALSVDGTTQNAYYMRPGGSFTTATSLPINLSITPARLSIGRQPIFGTSDVNGVVQFGAIIVYDAVLTATEIQRQMVANTRKPIRWDNLNFWNDCLSNSAINVDQTGKKGNWTTTGSPSSSTQDPSAPWDISGPGLYVTPSVSSVTGDLAITGSGATLAMSGQAVDSGTLAITGSGGTVAMQGQAIAGGALGITGSGGTVAMAGTLTSAGTLGITGSGGTVTAYQQGPTVTSHASKRYLVDQNSNPFRIHGDAAYDLFVNLSLANLRTYLDDRRTRGFNTLITQLTDPVKYHASSNAPAAVGAGNAKPFLLNTSGGTWSGTFASHDADFSSPNATYFAWCRQAVQEIGTRGMVAIINPVYLGFNNGASDGWWQDLVNAANTQTVCYNFGLYLAGYFADLPNIIWCLGVDMFPAAASEGETRFGKVFLGLQDGGCTQPMIAHGKASSDSRDYNANLVSYVTLNGVYAHGDYSTPSTAHNAHGRARLAYAKTTPDMVCFHLEGMYEDGTDVTEHGASRQQLRSEHWGALLSTIGGTIFGNGDVWTFATSWSTSLDSDGANDFQKIDDLLASRSWHLLVPNGLGSIGTLITAGGGTAQTTGSVGSNDGNNGTDYVVAACTPDGTLMLCYEPDGHSGSFTVDMSKMSGSTTARWYDPTDGSFSTDAASPLAASGTHAFTNPGNNAGGDTDWVLVLEAGPTGTMAITGSGGTVAMSGTTNDVGSIAITGSGGTVAMLGTSPDTGTMDITGSGGTVAMAGTTNIAGTLGIVGSGGTVAASGTSNIFGTLAIGGSGGSVDARESAYSGQDDMFLIQ